VGNAQTQTCSISPVEPRIQPPAANRKSRAKEIQHFAMVSVFRM